MASELSKQQNIEIQPVPEGFVDNAKQNETKRNLEILLGDKNLDPKRAEDIREQIKAIDSGVVVAPVSEENLYSGSQENINSIPNKDISPEVLAGALSGDIDLIKASELGAGYEAMEALIKHAKEKSKGG